MIFVKLCAFKRGGLVPPIPPLAAPVPALAITMEKDTYTNKKSNFYKFVSDIAESSFGTTSHSKRILIY